MYLLQSSTPAHKIGLHLVLLAPAVMLMCGTPCSAQQFFLQSLVCRILFYIVIIVVLKYHYHCIAKREYDIRTGAHFMKILPVNPPSLKKRGFTGRIYWEDFGVFQQGRKKA